MQYKDRKLRPGRIAQGVKEEIKSKITGEVSEEAELRRGHCNGCPLRENGKCKICGCVTDLKTQSENDYCPKNKWDDIKIVESVGVAVKNLSPDLVELYNPSGETAYVTFREDIPKNGNGSFKLRLINDRANFFKEHIPWVGMTIKTSCGCTSVVEDMPERLRDGKHFDITVDYDTSRLGNFEKTVQISSDSAKTLQIVVKGNVKNNE